MKETEMLVKYGGEVIGKVVNNIYVTKKRKEHFMIKFGGFGISSKVLVALWEGGIRKVRFEYDGERGFKVYECDLIMFLESNKVFSNKTEEGEDKQKFVSIAEMEVLQ